MAAFDGAVKDVFFAEVIIGSQKIPKSWVSGFEWKSFVNGGYEIRIMITDGGNRMLNNPGTSIGIWDKEYLAKARKDPVMIQFKIGYQDDDPSFKTNDDQYQKAILTDLTTYGSPAFGSYEFVAIDMPSWYLNAGKAEGKIFTGNITKVIEKVVKESSNGVIKSMVSKTEDSDQGKWAMMRQDPKTFILSLLDWSAQMTAPPPSRWMIGMDDEMLFIQDQKDYLARTKSIASFTASNGTTIRNQLIDYSILNNTLITGYQTKLMTQGISATSGKYLDLKTARDKVEVTDKNTKKKLNTKTSDKQGFKKPSVEYSTSIVAIPELNGGEIGIIYEDWIRGRPMQLYLDMLPMIMRVRFTFSGDPRFYDNSNLGVATMKLTWKDIDGTELFLSGKWIVYGFHHRMNRHTDEPHWLTDVYAYRIDTDAASQKL